MDWQKWNKNEPARLACYVQVAETVRVFGPPHMDADLRRDRLAAVRHVYEFLSSKGIPYDTSQVDFAGHHEAEQVIRQPSEVRDGGNCLELTLLFAALCQRAGLRTLLVLLEQHAMIAVRLDHDVESLGASPGPHDHELLSGGLLPAGCDVHGKAAKLAEWEEQGRCVLVECTGMAGWSGSLSFDGAVVKARSRLTDAASGALTQVVDVTLLLLNEKSPYRPYAVTAQSASSVDAADVILGNAALEVVKAYLARLASPPPEPLRWNVDGLHTMLTAVGGGSALGVVLEGLGKVLKAAAFAVNWMPHELTTERLRAAMTEMFPGKPLPDASAVETDYLAHVFLHRAPRDDGWEATLVGYLAAVALGGGLDVRHPRFRGWAASLLKVVGANDVIKAAEERHSSTRWRLRISLHGSPTGRWPESVTAWLFNGDTQVSVETEPCDPEQSSVEAAVADLLASAIDTTTYRGGELKQVEIAVPTRLLVIWYPEKTTVVSRIGLHHDVVVRWSERLGPPYHMRKMLSEAPKRWKFIEQHGAGGLDWLEPEQASDVKAVREQLENGTYQGAVGLRFLPEKRDDLLETLLLFSPVLLWPDKDQCTWAGIERELSRHWESLPRALADAYRTSWTQRDEPPTLAVVRAVWDDEDWMAFCRSYLRSQTSLRRLRG